jgi:hypothetical protein
MGCTYSIFLQIEWIRYAATTPGRADGGGERLVDRGLTRPAGALPRPARSRGSRTGSRCVAATRWLQSKISRPIGDVACRLI